MLNSIRRNLRSIKTNRSGNAALLVALGLPALMGSSGLAVDVAQWYMWQRELQFAADQAALAGAWARSNTATQSSYVTRANQEFQSNLAATETGSGTPTASVSLDNYQTGTNNAVLVTASVTKSLPFTTFITGQATTVSVSAKATFSMTGTYNSCILSVNPTENRSAIFGNAITGGSDCGVGALSTGTQAIVETGDSEVALGDIISGGGIEETFSNNGTIHENVAGLSDPYGALETPSASGFPAYTYECPTATSGSTIWTADRTVRTIVTYLYKRGNVASSATPIVLSPGMDGYLAPSDETVGPTNTVFTTAPTEGELTFGPVTGSYTLVAGTGTGRIWRAPVTTIIRTIGTVTGPIVTGASDGVARPLPGVYTNISINCPTVFSSGIYFISGSFDFGQNYPVTGSDVMFVFTGSSGDIRINATSQVTLSGISKATLMGSPYNYSDAIAGKMENMLFFDKDNSSTFNINGGANLDFNGIVYMPAREVLVNGNMSSGSRCIMLVSDTFTITGSANLTNFCSPSDDGGMVIGERPATVRLVA